MSLQLFSFGHPCEHQLRRQCIGGDNCPLNGYPDAWCCSFIKGKINFKRDKPCEGPRCRWGFAHPSQSQFDAVTQVLNESRPIAAKLDDADDKEQITFNIENSYLVDTVQCALHMMRHPPISRATRVGQLLAYAALRAADPKVFMQLLKTLKKPVDGYLLGAYDYLTSGNLPTAAAVATVTSTNTNAQGKAAGKKGHSDKKEDVSEELRNDMVDLMNAALSSGGQLVNREDQHTLQAVFIQALRSYPKSNKKRQEMLELAVAKFGSRPVAKSAPATTTAAGQVAAAANTPNTNHNAATNAAAAANANTPRHAGAAGTMASANAAASGKAGTATSPNVLAATAAAAAPAGGGGSNSTSNTMLAGSGGIQSKISGTLEEGGAASAPISASLGASITSNNTASMRRPQVVGGTSTLTTVSTRNRETNSTSPARQPSTTQEPLQRQMPPQPQPVVGISRVAQQVRQAPALQYEPIRTDLPLPNVALFGGLFGLTPQSASWALLGAASSFKSTTAMSSSPAPAAASCGSPFVEAAGEVDDKLMRFMSAAAPAYNLFSGIDGLSTENRGMKTLFDD
ncbi:hypothetical protein TraAM80_06352 [Trypanosoma rangeli]|uniref:Uncharacterized protein n=1 Tax=Trypanosoma rangeli TaxID=5698 RepID=A0A3R7MAT7_TRYRA|nr:uncharacterized protein TraAM80_06352 [Trypanosoma rangeli]RNF02527.1 hypothetical protein TraAM80_06352 [Trypanosoma rangeli]|eukprot:RNF02527.1 hypothetical protein TraAM80_06352 [Trypanosoma rangeli]